VPSLEFHSLIYLLDLEQVNDIQLKDSILLEYELIFASVFLVIVVFLYFYLKDVPILIEAPENIPKVHILFAR
jgi:hypothetical protein